MWPKNTAKTRTFRKKQIARNVTDCEDGFLNRKRYLILDRDSKFSEAFRGVLEAEAD